MKVGIEPHQEILATNLSSFVYLTGWLIIDNRVVIDKSSDPPHVCESWTFYLKTWMKLTFIKVLISRDQ